MEQPLDAHPKMMHVQHKSYTEGSGNIEEERQKD